MNITDILTDSAGSARPAVRLRRLQSGKAVIYLLLGAYALFSLFPLVFMISSSLKPVNQVFEFPFRLIPREIRFQNYVNLFSGQYSFVRWYGNTLLMVGTTLILKLLIVGLASYAFARLRFRGRDVLFLVMLSALMIPPDVTIIPRYVIYKYIRITDSMWSLVLPYTFDVFFVFLLRQFFMGIPASLTESAYLDGCSHFQIFFRIINPLAKSAYLTMILFTFVWAWNDFISPYIFITDTKKQMLSVGINLFKISHVTNYSMQMAAACLILVPVLILFFLAQKYFIEGIAHTGLKG